MPNDPHPAQPCIVCDHPFRKHDRIENTADPIARYRCDVTGCYCGQKYEPIVVALDGTETEEQREAIMLAMGQEHDRRVEQDRMQKAARAIGNFVRDA